MGRKPHNYNKLKDKIVKIVKEEDEILQSNIVQRLKDDEWVDENYASLSVHGRVSEGVRELEVKHDELVIDTGYQPEGQGRTTNKVMWIED